MRGPLRRLSLIATLLATLLVGIAAGVSAGETGAAGSGRTITIAPGESIQAVFDAALPGDTILLEPGRHEVQGNLVLRRSGNRNAWIRVMTVPGQTRAVIDLNGSGEFRISGSYVVLRRVKIRHGGGNNLHIAPEGGHQRNVIVRQVNIRALDWGPGAAIKINRNGQWNVKLVYLLENNLSGSINNAVVDGVGVRKVTVRGNRIHHPGQGSHGIFFKGGSWKILIENNKIFGIRGNAALQLGGNTGPNFFDPAFPNWEGVNQTARGNELWDFDDSAFEIRGVKRGFVYENDVNTQTTFAIFRLQCGEVSGGGGFSGNDEIEIHDNVITATGDPQYARNDCGPVDVSFARQTWIGQFHNSPSAGPNIPTFPLPSDTVG